MSIRTLPPAVRAPEQPRQAPGPVAVAGTGPAGPFCEVSSKWEAEQRLTDILSGHPGMTREEAQKFAERQDESRLYVTRPSNGTGW